MLMPKRVKHRKVMRGRMSGMAKGGHTGAFGDYGRSTLEPAWLTSRQIEAARPPPTPSLRLALKSGRRTDGRPAPGPRIDSASTTERARSHCAHWLGSRPPGAGADSARRAEGNHEVTGATAEVESQRKTKMCGVV